MRVKPGFYWRFDVAAEQVAEKVDSAKIFVGQGLLPVRVFAAFT